MPKTTDTILLNPSFNALTPFQENLYWRLRDLFQRYPGVQEVSAEPADLKSTLYPLKRDLRESQVQSALTALTLAGMIAVYPDDTGHPYLRLISADSLTSHGGDYRGGGGRGGGSYETVSSSSESNGEDGETIVNPTNANPSWDTNKQGDAAYLGLTSEEVQASMERYEKVEEAANHYGLNASHGCVQDALELADAYSMDWLLKAMKLARDAKWKWKFVESQLARWKEEGGPDSTGKAQDISTRHNGRSSIRRSKKTDAELDEELKKWGVNLGG